MTTMAFNIPLFRERFPAFADTTAFPDASLTVRWTIATQYIRDTSYGRLTGDKRELALQLMTAHLEQLNQNITTGAAHGQIVGASEDGVSVTLTPPPNTDQYEWWLNQTPYGSQLYSLLATCSVGGFYIGGAPELAAFRGAYGRFN